MEPISYFNALLADPHITMVPFQKRRQHPSEVTRLYVPLRVSEERQPEYVAPASDAESTENTEADLAIARIEEERQRRGRSAGAIYDPEKAIQTFQRCMFIGDSGAGKTMLLRYLAILAAQRSIAGMLMSLPVYVELASFARSGLHDVLDFASATWQERYAFPAQQARLLLANFLDEGKALLLLDALNEAVVGETPEAAERSYEAVSQAILALAARFPKAPIAVTVRKASYKQHRPLVGFTALEVMDFRFEDAKQFVQNWYDASYDGMADAMNRAPAQKSADLIRHLEAKPHLQTFTANPLLLTLMVHACADGRSLPERRAEFYRVCIETMLIKEELQPGEQRQWEFEPEQKHQLFKAIAWHFHRKRQRYFAEHDLLRVIAEFLQAINIPVERNKDIMQEIEREQGALRRQATGWYGFLHLSLQEYFAAAYINDRQEYAELYQHRADSWWEEVLLLYIGITPDASLFLRQLCSQQSTIREDIFYTNVLLAGRCLAAHPTVRETGLRTQIIERLFELLMSTRYSMLRQEAIKVVCDIGKGETNRRLVTLLSDKRLDVFVRWNIAGALGTLGERSVAGELVRLLTSERLHTELRRGIADALGRLAESSVAGELVRLLTSEQLEVELRKSIARTLGRLGERSIASELVQLLADERLDASLRRSIADALGTLGERSVVEDLVQLLADDLLDVNLRRSIADTLGTLGEWSIVAGAMVGLLADDQQDMFVRRRITGALGTLAEVSGSLGEQLERSVAKDLVQLLADDWLDAELRRNIAEVLGMLGDRSVVRNLAQLLAEDWLDVNVRRAIAIALGRLGERSVAARALVQLLADERQDLMVRRSIADALGRLGERAVAGELVQMLSDERLDADMQWSIADALGRLGERSVTGKLAQMLSDERLDVFVRRSIAYALGSLGERSAAARAMVQMLADDRFGVFVRRGIADELGRLGERAVAGELVRLLSDGRLHEHVRQSIAGTLSRLGERSVAGDLVQLLSDERLEVELRKSIADALAAYAGDVSIVEGMIKSLQDKDLYNSVYSALWTISRRAGVWIFPVHVTDHARNVKQPRVPYEIVPWQ